MAVPITGKPNTSAPDSDYPYGNIKDNPGDGSGTPVNKLVYADFHQFFAKMLAESGVIANGLPDNAYSGFQYYEALLAVIQQGVFPNGIKTDGSFIKTKVVAIGNWNMSVFSTASVSHGLDATKIRRAEVIIINDASTIRIPLNAVNTSTGAVQGGIPADIGISSTAVNLWRLTGGQFDSTNFATASFNRGFVIIDYIA